MKKNTEKKVTADKAEIVNPIEGMKPRPNKAQVAEAMMKTIESIVNTDKFHKFVKMCANAKLISGEKPEEGAK